MDRDREGMRRATPARAGVAAAWLLGIGERARRLLVKRHWAVVGIVAMGALVLTALAQDATEPAAGERGARRAGNRDQARRQMMARRGGQGISLNTPGLNAVDDLTDEQKAKIAAIRKAAMEKMQELKKQMDADVLAELTPEQKAKAAAAAKAAARRGPGGITLTDDQKKILDDAREAASKVDDREAKMKIMREAMEKVRATYTDEQKKQAEARGGRGGRERGKRNPGNAPKTD